MSGKPTVGALHRAAVRDAKRAIEDVFSDTTVTAEETLASLQELRSELYFKISAIQQDLKRKQAEHER